MLCPWYTRYYRKSLDFHMMDILKFLIGIVDLDVVDFPYLFLDLPGKYSSSEYCMFMPDKSVVAKKIFYKQT